MWKKNVENRGFKFNLVLNGKIESQTRLIAENWPDWITITITITMENHPKIARTVNCACGTIERIHPISFHCCDASAGLR